MTGITRRRARLMPAIPTEQLNEIPTEIQPSRQIQHGRVQLGCKWLIRLGRLLRLPRLLILKRRYLSKAMLDKIAPVPPSSTCVCMLWKPGLQRPRGHTVIETSGRSRPDVWKDACTLDPFISITSRRRHFYRHRLSTDVSSQSFRCAEIAA